MSTTTETEARHALAADLHQLAEMVANNATVGSLVNSQVAWGNGLLIPLTVTDDPRAALREMVREGLAAGARIEKLHDDDWGGAFLVFDSGLRLMVYTDRDQVCERRVVGTKEVTKTVKDPAALAAVPEVEVTETVEVVEWDCHPILREAVSA